MSIPPASQKPTKICSKCQVEKPLNEFSKRKNRRGKIVLRKECLACRVKDSQKYYWEHKQEKSLYLKKYRYEHKEKNKIQCKQWRINNLEKARSKEKEYYSEHKKEISIRNKQYYIKNKEKIHIARLKYEKQRRKNDLNYNILTKCRCRIYQAVKNHWKLGSTISLIGCSIEELKIHIKKQWSSGMTWENWGSGYGKWQIDHIIPCSFFNMLDAVEQHMCFRYQNLRPLWWKDNMEKSDKITLVVPLIE